MKKRLILFVLLIHFITLAMANVYTVSNRPGHAADFNTLIDAYDASSDGDTLLIEGSNTAYEIENITKELTFIGIGFNPDKVLPTTTKFDGGIDISNNSNFFGIEFLNSLYIISGVSQIHIEDCLFTYGIYFDPQPAMNFLVKNSVFRGPNNIYFESDDFNNLHAIIENCIFDGSIEKWGIEDGTIEVSVNHCLFLHNLHIFYNFENSVLIQNSIIMHTGNPLGLSEGTFFYNNIFLESIIIPPVGSYGSGNLTGTDPLFVNYSSSPGHYSPLDDYDVLPGSPAIGAATDGTDIGLHGGTAGFSEYGEVLIVPIVRQITINNSTVAPGGTIDVQIKAGKPHTD